MTIRLATTSDLTAIMQIVGEVVSDMASYGNLQWSDTYPDKSRFLTDIDNNALYVAEIDGKVMGFVAIDQEQTKEYQLLTWSDEGDAFVIHRLAVSRDSRNLGVASHLEKFACQMALEHGVHQIRLDTYSTNAGMQTFLEKKGYRKVGEISFSAMPKLLPFVCFEKLLTPVP